MKSKITNSDLDGASVLALGATLKLSNVGRRFNELLQLTKLVTVFEVYNTGAVAS